MDAISQAGNWDDVQVFLAAHRMRSLGGAARRLGIDTSTVSRRLTGFEAQLQKRLFERGRDGLQPTASAEAVLAAAEAMEAAHARLTRDASAVEAEAEGVVRVSSAPGFSDVFIAPALPQLLARHPKLSVELDASMRTLNLARHEADLAVRSMRPEGADLLVTKIGDAKWVPSASPALAKKLGALKRWDAARWVTWDKDLSLFGPAAWVAKYAREATVALRSSHFASQLAAAEAGLGLVMVPEPYLLKKKLVAVRVAPALRASVDALPSDGLWLVGHRALRDVPRVSAVWNFFAQYLRETMRG